MIKILKHKDIDVAVIELTDGGIIINIKEVLNIKHMPLPTVREDGIVSDDRFEAWWLGRGISENREEYKYVMMIELNNIGKYKLLHLSKGLSLSDHYWMEREGENHKWKDVNFYENDFDKSLGKLFFGIKKKDRKYDFNSPDVTSSGNLKKRWDIREDGTRYLIKMGEEPFMQEPLNEVLATIICKNLKIPCISYNINYRKDEPYSECNNFTNNDRELIEAIDIYHSKEPTYENNNLYNHFMKCCRNYEVKGVVGMIDRMMVLDYILLNHDRHFKNFGVTRNSDNINDYKFAPIYDSGNSLFYKDKNFKIKIPEYAKERKICFDTIEKQLRLVRDWSWIKSETFPDLISECKEEIYKEKNINKERAGLLMKVLERRMEEIRIIAEKKQEINNKSNLENQVNDNKIVSLSCIKHDKVQNKRFKDIVSVPVEKIMTHKDDNTILLETSKYKNKDKENVILEYCKKGIDNNTFNNDILHINRVPPNNKSAENLINSLKEYENNIKNKNINTNNTRGRK